MMEPDTTAHSMDVPQWFKAEKCKKNILLRRASEQP